MKLTDEDVRNIRARIKNGEREIRLAEEYNVSRQAINLIKKNESRIGIGTDVSELNRANLREYRINFIRRSILEGYTARQIADELGVSIASISALKRKFLPELKYQNRSPYRSYKIPARKLSFKKATEMRDDRNSGLNIETLAERYSVSIPTVYAVLNGRVWNSEWTRE